MSFFCSALIPQTQKTMLSLCTIYLREGELESLNTCRSTFLPILVWQWWENASQTRFYMYFVMLETSVKVFGLEGIWVQSGLCVFVGVRSSPADDLPGPERWGYRVTPTVQYKGTRTQKHMRFTLTPNSWLIKHTITNRPPFTNEYSHYPDQVLLGSSNLQVQNFNYNLFSTNGTKWKAKYVHWCIII